VECVVVIIEKARLLLSLSADVLLSILRGYKAASLKVWLL
jgi:hypothetical protein